MKTLLVLLITLLQLQSDNICECVIIPYKTGENRQHAVFKNGFNNSDFVFYGEVIRLNDQNMEGWYAVHPDQDPEKPIKDLKKGLFPIFRVLSVFKKDMEVESTDTLQIYQRWSNCDMTFEKSVKYLVFASKSEDGMLFTSICLPNIRINSEQKLNEIATSLSF